MIGSLTSGAIFSAIWCKRRSLLKKRKSQTRAKTQCEAPYGRAENRFSRFFLPARLQAANLGTAQRVAEYSHGLLGFCTLLERDTLEGGKEHC